ncbi:hypothetical protein ACFVUY_37195 [Kitasatospora sp. NPDC058063]|uniref:hypothetical protein n=1 Tax=Kitasatospora sp. NPDC058063 TaxID=3346321 RepID=UPI0036DD2906
MLIALVDSTGGQGLFWIDAGIAAACVPPILRISPDIRRVLSRAPRPFAEWAACDAGTCRCPGRAARTPGPGTDRGRGEGGVPGGCRSGVSGLPVMRRSDAGGLWDLREVPPGTDPAVDSGEGDLLCMT